MQFRIRASPGRRAAVTIIIVTIIIIITNTKPSELYSPRVRENNFASLTNSFYYYVWRHVLWMSLYRKIKLQKS